MRPTGRGKIIPPMVVNAPGTSKQQNKIDSNSRTGNIAIINSVTTLLVAESRSDG